VWIAWNSNVFEEVLSNASVLAPGLFTDPTLANAVERGSAGVPTSLWGRANELKRSPRPTLRDSALSRSASQVQEQLRGVLSVCVRLHPE
jgi:hypothetical protein